MPDANSAKTISIYDIEFKVPQPYSEGHVLTAIEAKQLNQVFAENIANNQRAAIKKAIAREGITVDQLDIVEINEAFAAVSLASTRELGVDPAKVNRNGGAIAMGHPIGMSGARITLHAALELSRRGSGYAVAALCGAGGQGDALILRAG